MDNYFNYFTEVEEHFIRRRQKHLLVPPLDWCLIELWKESGIPIHVVIRGIDRSFETARSRRTSPRSLSYCHPAVTQAFEEHQRAMVGSGEEASEPTDFQGRGVDSARILEHVDRLSASLKARPEDFDGPLSLLCSLRKEVGAREQLDGRQIDQDLNHIGVVVAEVLRDEMDRKRLRSLRSEVRKEMKIYKRHLSRELYQRMQENCIHRKLRESAAIPEFGLLAMQLGETP
ncbi:MAG: hypothetical protein OXH11_09520 [Candidatus Aminicenantes bacterium]|nr:hypothetical protein [Candidatus Aminicenantes bacterium]